MPETYTPRNNGYSTTGLPVIPYTLTTIIDDIKYETHVLTNTCQVITEDGITLCDILKDLVTNEKLEEAVKGISFENPVYQYKGILLNKPGKTAIDQLYEKIGMEDGEVYLVQCTDTASRQSNEPVVFMSARNIQELDADSVNKRFDMYTWSKSLNQWLYFGSTEKSTLPVGFPTETVMEIPNTIGKPGQVIMVSANGKTLEWKFPNESTQTAIDQHNQDEDAHPAIWRELAQKADKLKIFNTVIPKSSWSWTGEHNWYSCVFSSANLPPHCYFEITPIAVTKNELENLKGASIHPIYMIESSSEGSYAVLNADHVPTEDIQVCVKVYGDFNEIT